MQRGAIQVNDRGPKGHPVGQDHPRAELTDHEVELMRQQYEEGLMGYRALARIWFDDVKRYTHVRDIVKFRRRAAGAVRLRPAMA